MTFSGGKMKVAERWSGGDDGRPQAESAAATRAPRQLHDVGLVPNGEPGKAEQSVHVAV